MVEPLEVKLERKSHKEVNQQLCLLMATLKEQSLEALPKHQKLAHLALLDVKWSRLNQKSLLKMSNRGRLLAPSSKMLEQLLPQMGLPLLLRRLQLHPQSQQNLSPRHL